MRYAYLLDKSRSSALSREPFKHIQIANFFSTRHSAMIAAAPEIAVDNLSLDAPLLAKRRAKDYKIIGSPGCIQGQAQYISWLRSRGLIIAKVNMACAGLPMILRRRAPQSPVIAGLSECLNSVKFQTALAKKTSIRPKCPTKPACRHAWTATESARILTAGKWRLSSW